jgi:hypothetical protein
MRRLPLALVVVVLAGCARVPLEGSIQWHVSPSPGLAASLELRTADDDALAIAVGLPDAGMDATWRLTEGAYTLVVVQGGTRRDLGDLLVRGGTTQTVTLALTANGHELTVAP